MKLSKKYLLILMLTTLVLQGCSAAASTNEPAKITVQLLPYMGYFPLYVAEEEGYFEAEGLDVEFANLSGNEVMVGLTTGDIDVAAGFLSVRLLSSIAQDGNIKIVADKGYINPSACTTNGIVARKELTDAGKLDDPSQLAGKTTDMDAATIEEFVLHKLLAPSELTGEELEVVSIGSPFAELEALGTGALDLGFFSEPWITRALNAGHTVVWKDYKDIIPDFQFSLIVFGPNLLNVNPEIGQRFMNAYLKALAQSNEGKTERNMELMMAFTELDQDLLEQVCWPTFREDGKINVESIIEFQEWAVEQGYLDAVLSEDQFWNSDFVDKANQ